MYINFVIEISKATLWQQRYLFCDLHLSSTFSNPNISSLTEEVVTPSPIFFNFRRQNVGIRNRPWLYSNWAKHLRFDDNTYLPALNANHPHHNIKRPTKALVGLPIGGAPSMSHLPSLGPSIQEATKALEPPTKWTAPDPMIAKYWLPW